MVKTRFHVDEDEDGRDEFVAMPARRSRRTHQVNHIMNGYGSDEESDGFEIPTRSTRSKREVVDETTPESDANPPRSKRSRRYEMGDTPEDGCLSTGYKQYSMRQRDRRVHIDVNLPTTSNEVNGDFEGIRRSSRQRRLTYNSMNQNIIDKELDLISRTEYTQDETHRRRGRSNNNDVPKEEVDMYTRVKRERKRVNRDIYGMPISGEDRAKDSPEGEERQESGGISSSSSSTEVNEQPEEKSYYLREHKPRTTLYEAPPIGPQQRRSKNIFRDQSPPLHTNRHITDTYHSPARRRTFIKRSRKRAFHGGSSTSSSSSSSDSASEDEHRFQRRKVKSMAKARQRCLPMNLTQDDISSGLARDRIKIGASLADVDPMSVDKNVNFESVGGLGKHVRSLKEMIVFPLLYPEVFERFKLAPPRGCLFYGPPGTGKTLVARALANECSTGERKVSFFMRKGADCLSKWVGESERQLRLLFDQAYQVRPSIIFFDEIDGLAPVRSSRQDQIHSSIVSTLLALMDGLDNRGEIVVIGATNRIDSIDPALRRPGRFDREFLFPLPSVEARKHILQIHTKEWLPKLSDSFLGEVAEKCVGYCGADLKSLCTESTLHALRRRYPQIYNSQEKLELNVNSINISARDFYRALQNIVPASQRAVVSPARSLSPSIKPLLSNILGNILEVLHRSFPLGLAQLAAADMEASCSNTVAPTSGSFDNELYSDEDDEGPDIFEATGSRGKSRKGADFENKFTCFMDFSSCALRRPSTHRPRLLISGAPGQGQSSHLGPAVLHHLECLPVHVLDLPALFAVSAKTPEESCAQVFREARRTSPSVVYLPHIGQWWDVIGEMLRATFLTLLNDLEPASPILLLATTDLKHDHLPTQIQELFDSIAGEVVVMHNPTDLERRDYFEDLLMRQAIKPPATHKQAATRVLEDLPKAQPMEARKLNATELRRLHQQEEVTLRELRLFLRDVLNKLVRDKKFNIFVKPVDEEDVPDYYEIIKSPMDLSTMMSKVDLHKYLTVRDFMCDIELICSNCLEYNPDTNPSDRALRHRACALKDTSHGMITAELDPDFEKMCEEIKDSRVKRGESPTKTVPDYYFTKPLSQTARRALDVHLPANYPSRYSRRIRGIEAIEDEPGEAAAKDPTAETSPSSKAAQVPEQTKLPPGWRKVMRLVRRSSSNVIKPKNKSPWCKPTRRKLRHVVIYIDESGNEWTPNAFKRKMEGKADESSDDSEVKISGKWKITKNKTLSPEKMPSEVETNEADTEVSVNVREDISIQITNPTVVIESIPKDACVGKDDSIMSSPKSPRGRRPLTPPRAAHSPRTRQISEGSGPCSPGREKTTSPDRHATDCKAQEESIVTRRRSRNNPEEEEVENMGSPSPKKTDSPTKTSSPCKAGEEILMELSTCSPKNDAENLENDANVIMTHSPDKQDQEKSSHSSPNVRVTRSHTGTGAAQWEKALQILEQETPKLVVDEDKLRHLLALTVEQTRGYSVERLERLYSLKSQCIYHFRREYDKTQLIQELESLLASFTSSQGYQR